MDQKRKEILQGIDPYIIETRYSQVDPDYLEFEIKMSSIEDLQKINDCLWAVNNLKKTTPKLPLYDQNPYNSILLYITGLTNAFDFSKERGTPKLSTVRVLVSIEADLQNQIRI